MLVSLYLSLLRGPEIHGQIVINALGSLARYRCELAAGVALILFLRFDKVLLYIAAI